MKIQDITGRPVKVSRSTISVLNDDGKTAGMVTRVDTFYTCLLYTSPSPRDS